MWTLRKRGASTPAYPVQPSGQYIGNDGRWSTFLIDVGSPVQQFSTLISTSSLATWLVRADACSTSRDSTVAQHADCSDLRGSKGNRGWQSGDSKSFKALGIYALQLNEGLHLDTIFGRSPLNNTYRGAVYNSSAAVGRDRVSLPTNADGMNSVPANDSLVYGVLDQTAWVSMVGIGRGPTKFDRDTSFPSLLDIYFNQSSIPSRTWGYTAGAYYKNSFGSLTLGGYDSDRLDTPIGGFKMVNSQLMVTVQSISVEDSTSATISVTKTGDNITTFNAVIDSTVPYLYLPQTVCDKFASLFGLRYDSKTDLYLLNATQRSINSGYKIHFVVSDTNNGLPTSKEIILPYAAFDLNLSWPISDDAVPYFPIRRSVGDNAVLGRTFLQEAFVIADYEWGNFTIGRAISAQSNIQKIVSIQSPLHQSETNRLSKGAIAGIVIGGVTATALVAALIWLLFHRRKKNKVAAAVSAAQAAGADTKDAKKVMHADIDEEDRPGHSRHLSELSGSSTLVGANRKSTISGTGGGAASAVYEAETREVIHEMEDKTDTAVWAHARRRMSDRDAVRYELDANSTVIAPVTSTAASPVTGPVTTAGPVTSPATTTAAASPESNNPISAVSAESHSPSATF